jgi:hypothetical protein
MAENHISRRPPITRKPHSYQADEDLVARFICHANSTHVSQCLWRGLGMTHPSHSRPRRGDRQAPRLEPALHDADLCLLGEGDVRDEQPHVVAVCLVAHYLGHLYGLGVVDHHVAGEACLRRVVAGRSGEEQYRRRARCAAREQDEH